MTLSQPLIFVDVETTGTDPQKHEIIELGLVRAEIKNDELVVVDQLDLKIHPKRIEDAEPQALRVNGYNEADWLFATTIEDAMKAFVQKSDGAIFIAHNMIFDYQFIESALKNTGIEHTMHFHKLDTLSMAFGVLHGSDDINRLSLGALCDYYGIQNKKAHSAFADAYATYELCKKLLGMK